METPEGQRLERDLHMLQLVSLWFLCPETRRLMDACVGSFFSFFFFTSAGLQTVGIPATGFRALTPRGHLSAANNTPPVTERRPKNPKGRHSYGCYFLVGFEVAEGTFEKYSLMRTEIYRRNGLLKRNFIKYSDCMKKRFGWREKLMRKVFVFWVWKTEK